jgi:hypothetical protein
MRWVISVELETNIPMTIIKVAMLLLIGVMILVGIDSGSATHSSIITLSENPVDGETITVNGVVYEFDDGDGVASGNTAVQIAYTPALTSANLQRSLGIAGFTVVIL